MSRVQLHHPSNSSNRDQTAENLYQLGLLRRPKEHDKPRSETARPAVPAQHRIHHEEPRRSGSLRSIHSSNSGKQPALKSRQSHASLVAAARRPQTANPQAGHRGIYQDLGDQTFDGATNTSLSWRAGKPMAGLMEMDRARTRRERTFIGSECAVCEEPLEHTLRGERILQFSCGHVSHEACFYEYIKEFDAQSCPTCNAPLGLDTSRGGNILDIEKLSNMVRSMSTNEGQQRSAQNTPTPWETQSTRERASSNELGARPRDSHRDSRDSQRERIEKLGVGKREPQPVYQPQPVYEPPRQPQPPPYETQGTHRHQRNDSGTTGVASSTDYDAAQPHARRHDYDVQSMETDLSSPRNLMKNPIPPPIVTVRSEFPTLNRSRQQQSLTCLVTIEVPEGKWQPDPDDLRHAPSVTNDDTVSLKKRRAPPAAPSEPTYEAPEVLEEVTEELKVRVDNWHGLEFSRFGKLRLHGIVRVGKDRQSWQELECYLFGEMLICVKEKRGAQPQYANGDPTRNLSRCTLKGSILIKKHLRHVESAPGEPILTLNLSVNELPCFHLFFQSRNQLELWKRALLDLHLDAPLRSPQEYEQDTSGTDEDEYRGSKSTRRVSSIQSSYGAGRSAMTAPTEYTVSIRGGNDQRMARSMHVPLDIVVVIPVSSSMQGLKINLLRDALKFLVSNLGERDRMGLVTFGSSGGGVPLVGMTTKAWSGWNKTLNSIRPVGQKSLRADVVEGANVAMDLLMQRKSNNPISTILLISDSSTSDVESVDFVIQRAEAAKVSIHSFGLGLTHKPDTMIELSTRTKASYMYVKDWMMLRECVAGCLGSLQTTSHQNVKLKLRLPEGSPAKFVKISGALQITKRATGKDAEAALGDLRFGDKRDILIQLAIAPDNSSQEQLPQDPWETIVSGLEALGGGLDNEDQRVLSVEEVPLIQADLIWNDILRDGSIAHLPRPSLLAITMLPAHPRNRQNGRPMTPPIPPHPSVVQRRMELLTSDMLTRALTLVSRGQHERAHHLLHETRTILKGLAKGGLPPLPPPGTLKTSASGQPLNSAMNHTNGSSSPTARSTTPTQPGPPPNGALPPPPPSPSHSSNSGGLHSQNGGPPSSIHSPGVDAATMAALDADIEASLEWINHPAVFSRDSRKAVLQAIGVISSQRGYTFRTPSEALWAERISGVRKVTERGREWRDESSIGGFGEVAEE